MQPFGHSELSCADVAMIHKKNRTFGSLARSLGFFDPWLASTGPARQIDRCFFNLIRPEKL